MAFNQEAWDKLEAMGYKSREPVKKEESKGFFSRLSDSWGDRADKVKKMFDTFQKSKSTGLRGLGEAAATGTGIAGQIAGGIMDVGAEAAISAGKAVLSDETEKEIADFVSSVGQSKPVQNIARVVGAFEEEHPFASAGLSGAANILSLTGTGAVGKAVTKPIKKAATGAIKSSLKAGEKALPNVAKAIKGASTIAKDVSSSAASQMLAMSPNTIKAIIEGKVSKEAIQSLDRVSLASRAKEGIDSALDDLSGLGSEYEAIRKSGQVVDIPVGGRMAVGNNVLREFSEPLVKTLNKYGLSIDESGKIIKSINSKPFDEQTINAIQDFVSTYGKTGQLTADQFLNVRQAADKIVDWNTKSPDLADSFAKTLRQNYDEIGKREIDGLEALDNQFSPMRQELGMIKRDFLTPSGQLKDTAYTSLANLTNKGREQVLARLEKYVPGITDEIHVLRAVEDIASANGIKVGTYIKAGITYANPFVGLLSFVITHPSIAVPILRSYGQAKREFTKTIQDILKKMKTGDRLTAKEKQVFESAIKSAAEDIPDEINTGSK